MLGFPFLFRGALDVRATAINEPMKVAAAEALAALAREDVPDDVAAAYQGNRPRFGREYIIPVPFDPRLISTVPPAVARAAMETGVARRPIEDMERYANELSARRDPVAGSLSRIFTKVRQNPRRVVFAEGEEEAVIRAAASFVNQELGTAVLIGREETVREQAFNAGIEIRPGLEIANARLSKRNTEYAQFLYAKLQRRGHLMRDCVRMINQDRNYFGATMVALGDGDALVTGVTRNYAVALETVKLVIPTKPGHKIIGVSLVLARGRSVLVADTAVTDDPSAEDLADIAEEVARMARRLGYEPRVALLAAATFGNPPGERATRVREAVSILNRRRVDFEFDGEMAADVALNPVLMAAYPFCRLSGPANVLLMPSVHAASIATKVAQELGGSTVLGPILVGLDKAVQIVPFGARDTDIVNMAAIASFGVN